MNKSIDERVIETFDPETWQEDVPKILVEPGIGVFEKWLDQHADEPDMIDKFVDTFIECYEWFSPQQPRNIYTVCHPSRIRDIVNRVHQSGDFINYKWLLDHYILLRTNDKS